MPFLFTALYFKFILFRNLLSGGGKEFIAFGDPFFEAFFTEHVLGLDLEGNFGFFSAVLALDPKHWLFFAKLGFVKRGARFAAFWYILQTFIKKKFLLAGSPNKLISAIFAH